LNPPWKNSTSPSPEKFMFKFMCKFK